MISLKQAQYQLARARAAYSKALNGFDDARKERTADNVAKWEVIVRVAKGQDEEHAFLAVHRT